MIVKENNNFIEKICSFLKSNVFENILNKPLISKHDGNNFIEILNDILKENILSYHTLKDNEQEIKNIVSEVKFLIRDEGNK